MKKALWCAAGVSVLALAGASAEEKQIPQHLQQQESAPKAIDFEAFHKKSLEIAKLHKARVIDVPKLLEMMKLKNTVVLDVRSSEAFVQKHIKGSVNIDYAEITEKSLSELVPAKDSPIILVCDESMENMLTRRLALNTNAFPLVYQLGYENVYELERLWRSKDPEGYERMLPLVNGKPPSPKP